MTGETLEIGETKLSFDIETIDNTKIFVTMEITNGKLKF